MASHGWIVATRVVEDALAATLAKLDAAIAAGGTASDDLLGRMFFNYPSTERGKVKAFLAQSATKAAPIVRNYPRFEQEFPCYVVMIVGGQQSQQYMGDIVETMMDPDTGDEIEVTGERWVSGTAIRTYAEHPDHLEWLHQIAKWGMSDQRLVIAEVRAVYGQKMAERDLAFDQNFIRGAGRFVYHRELLFTLEYDQVDADPTSLAGEITGHETAPTEVLHG